MKQDVRTGDRQRYATKIAGLWRGLSEALDRLERIAADPVTRLGDPDELDGLPRLQYTLHAASEGFASPAYNRFRERRAKLDPFGDVQQVEDTEAYKTTKPFFPDDLGDEVVTQVQETAVQAYTALQLRDYGRIDFRLATDGTIHVLEVNPNPYLLPTAARVVTLTLVGAIAVCLGALLGEWPVAAAGLTLIACALLRRWA